MPPKAQPPPIPPLSTKPKRGIPVRPNPATSGAFAESLGKAAQQRGKSMAGQAKKAAKKKAKAEAMKPKPKKPKSRSKGGMGVPVNLPNAGGMRPAGGGGGLVSSTGGGGKPPSLPAQEDQNAMEAAKKKAAEEQKKAGETFTSSVEDVKKTLDSLKKPEDKGGKNPVLGPGMTNLTIPSYSGYDMYKNPYGPSTSGNPIVQPPKAPPTTGSGANLSSYISDQSKKFNPFDVGKPEKPPLQGVFSDRDPTKFDLIGLLSGK